jgi:uncharacterized damage-inducible protein DinB
MNPYASQLGDRDPFEVIEGTPGRLRALVEKLGEQGLERALAPGKWSVREILCHLADCELVFAFRLRQTLAEPYHIVQPFDQEKWALTYAAYDAHSALAVCSTVRAWNVKLVRSIGPDARAKRLAHPERGEMTFQTLVETMAGHDLNHQCQIETIAGQSGANQSGAASAKQS